MEPTTKTLHRIERALDRSYIARERRQDEITSYVDPENAGSEMLLQAARRGLRRTLYGREGR